MKTLMKETIESGLAYSFRGSVRHHYGGKHGGTQAVKVPEKQLGVLHLHPRVAGRVRHSFGLTRAFETPKPMLSVPLQSCTS